MTDTDPNAPAAADSETTTLNHASSSSSLGGVTVPPPVASKPSSKAASILGVAADALTNRHITVSTSTTYPPSDPHNALPATSLLMSLLNRGDDKHRFIKTLVAILRARLLPLVHGTETRAHSNPWLVALWKNLGVPPMSVVALVGVVALAFVRRLMKREPLLLTNLVGVLYPAYQSLKAVERPEPDDDERWLTYWSVFGGFTLLDTQSHKFDKYTRYYYLAKMLALHWLYARSGSLAVYRQVIRPFLVKYGGYGVVHAADPTSINGTAGLVVENPGPFRKDL